MIQKHNLVRFVCTDRGTHPSRELALLLWVTGKGATVDRIEHAAARRSARGDNVRMSNPFERENGVGTALFRFPCHTCGRDVRLSEERANRLVGGLIDRDIHLFDLSQGS